MKRLISVVAVVLLVPSLPAASAKAFSNCTQLQKVYKYGVARSVTASKAVGVITPAVNAKVYNENKKLDRDNDGIACEVTKAASVPTSKPTPTPTPTPTQTNPTLTNLKNWQYGPVVLDSQILGYSPVDVEPVVIGDRVRIYVERFGVRGIVSFSSSDGVNFSADEGVRLASGAFPSVVTLSDGSLRMYFADGPDIFSAVSKDGLSWTKEAGSRAVGKEAAVVQLKDGRWLMSLRVDGSETPSAMACNTKVSHIDLLVSTDGLNFTRVARAIDSVKDSALNGRAYGNEFARLSDGKLYLMYEGCSPLFMAEVDESSLAIKAGTEVTALRGKAVADHYGQGAEIGGAGGDHGFVIFKGVERTYFGVRSSGGSRERIATAVLTRP